MQHADDLKMSHGNPQEVTIFIDQLKGKFEDENGTMAVTRGKNTTIQEWIQTLAKQVQ